LVRIVIWFTLLIDAKKRYKETRILWDKQKLRAKKLVC